MRRLALPMGVPNVDHLLAQVTPRQLDEWMALYLLDPWGEVRTDAGFAKVAAALGGGSPSDYMPRIPDEWGESDSEAQAQQAAAAEVAAVRRLASAQEIS